MDAYYGRPTTYKGIQMRSRLEAATAAAFDRHDVAWTYEPECFQAEDGSQYLPDFLVIIDLAYVTKDPHNTLEVVEKAAVYFEVKPTHEKALEAVHTNAMKPLHEAGCMAVALVPTTGEAILTTSSGSQYATFQTQHCRRCSKLVLGPPTSTSHNTGWYMGCRVCDSPRALLCEPLVPEDYSKAPQPAATSLPSRGALAAYRGNGTAR